MRENEVPQISRSPKMCDTKPTRFEREVMKRLAHDGDRKMEDRATKIRAEVEAIEKFRELARGLAAAEGRHERGPFLDQIEDLLRNAEPDTKEVMLRYLDEAEQS